MTTERFELSTKLDAVVVESNKTLEELAVVRGAFDHVEWLERYMVG